MTLALDHKILWRLGVRFERHITYLRMNTVLRHLLPLTLVVLATLTPARLHAAPGDLYISDDVARTVFRVAGDGRKTVVASGLDYAAGIAFDKSGTLHFAAREGAVHKMNPDGTSTMFAAGFESVGAIAFDGFGNLFVADSSANTISRVAPDGSKTIFTADVNQPVGLAFDIQGNLWEADFGSGKIFKFAPDGTKTRFASITDRPVGLAFDRNGNLFVSEASFGYIANFAPDGTLERTFVNVHAFGLAFDREGFLFAATSGGVERLAPDGTRSTFTTARVARYLAFEPPAHKLLNISARGFVGPEDNTLIAGFILNGTALANNAIVIRALGPSLPRTGTLAPLQDPRLEVVNSDGTVIALNDNWTTTQKTQIADAHLAPSDERESAILAALPAGAYTAVVRGANDTTGTALVEVYDIH